LLHSTWDAFSGSVWVPDAAALQPFVHETLQLKLAHKHYTKQTPPKKNPKHQQKKAELMHFQYPGEMLNKFTWITSEKYFAF